MYIDYQLGIKLNLPGFFLRLFVGSGRSTDVSFGFLQKLDDNFTEGIFTEFLTEGFNSIGYGSFHAVEGVINLSNCLEVFFFETPSLQTDHIDT